MKRTIFEKNKNPEEVLPPPPKRKRKTLDKECRGVGNVEDLGGWA